MSESKSESRVLDVFGPNLVIETNGPVGLGGPIAYQLYAVNDKGAKWQQALHGSGLASMEADHTLEIQTGKKNKKEHVSYMACLLYTSPSPRDQRSSRMPSSA